MNRIRALSGFILLYRPNAIAQKYFLHQPKNHTKIIVNTNYFSLSQRLYSDTLTPSNQDQMSVMSNSNAATIQRNITYFLIMKNGVRQVRQ